MATADAGLPTAGASESAAAARLVRRVLKQWWLIAICAVVAGAAAFFVSSRKEDTYQATTTIQLNEVDLAQVFLGQYVQQLQGQDVESKTATNARLVNTPRVQEATARALGGDITAEDIAGSVSASAEPDTLLVSISAVSDSAEEAARIADATREAFIEVRRQAAVSQYNAAKESLTAQLASLPESQKNSAQTQIIRDRLQQVDSLRAVTNGGVETAQTARVPEYPIGPNPRRDAILGLLAGGLLGLGIALLRARLDERIQDVSELSEHWNLPVLGLIPQTSELKDGSKHLAGGSALEAFALARTNLRYLHVGGEVKTVVVTSAIAEEGKSTVAYNLAIAAAMADQKVLLIDADLRRPVIALRAGIAGGRGLSEVLAGIASPAEVIVPTTLNVSGGDVSLDIVPAGLVPPSPIALLERSGTAALFDELAAGYDLVFIDTPPATVVADAKVIMSHADGVVVVSRLGRITRPTIDRLRDLLTGLGTPVLGTVVNSGAGAKAYGYSSYESTQSTPPAQTAPPSSNGAAADAPTAPKAPVKSA